MVRTETILVLTPTPNPKRPTISQVQYYEQQTAGMLVLQDSRPAAGRLYTSLKKA